MDYPRISKSQIKFLQSIKLKKYRQKYNKYSIEGHKIVTELIVQRPTMIDMVLGTEDWIFDNEKLLDNFDGQVCIASSKNMEMISHLKSASPVYLLCSMNDSMSLAMEGVELSDKLTSGRYLFLENLQDPGNVGTIFRTADWFGYDGVILSNGSTEVYNMKVIQSSMGSVFRVPHAYIESEKLQKINLPKIGTSLNGSSLKSFEFPENFILLLGNEGRGLQQETMDFCDYNILIENEFLLGAESLNVASSAAILMYESRR